MRDTTRPSGVRVFCKSLHMLAGGWAASVLWLWLVGLRQHVDRFGTAPADLAMPLVIVGAVPAVALGLIARSFGRLAGVSATTVEDAREWRHAFWWALLPNLFLLATAYLLIVGPSW